MSEQQIHDVESHLLTSLVIVETMVELFKKEDEQRACIVMEALDILPQLESNIEKSYSILNGEA